MKEMDKDKDFHYSSDLLNDDINEKESKMDGKYFEMNHDMYKVLDDRQHRVMNDMTKDLEDE
jgi:hypothetical protein